MKITMVKKIKENGTPCRKCAEVEKRLHDVNLMNKIDDIIIADERDPDSEGIRLAVKYNVETAPFFIVEEEGQAPRIYTVYMKFLKEVLGKETSAEDAAKDIIDANPDLDYI